MKCQSSFKLYYFDGSNGCDICKSATGFSLNRPPKWPHPYCDCTIEEYVLNGSPEALQISDVVTQQLAYDQLGFVNETDLASHGLSGGTVGKKDKPEQDKKPSCPPPAWANPKIKCTEVFKRLNYTLSISNKTTHIKVRNCTKNGILTETYSLPGNLHESYTSNGLQTLVWSKYQNSPYSFYGRSSVDLEVPEGFEYTFKVTVRETTVFYECDRVLSCSDGSEFFLSKEYGEAIFEADISRAPYDISKAPCKK